MAILTVDELRAREASIRTIRLDPNDENSEVEIRVPDLAAMLFMRLIPMDMVKHVLEVSDTLAHSDMTEQEAGDAVMQDETYCTFIDRWVAASMVNPKVALDRSEADAKKCLHISDLTLATRMRVFAATYREGIERAPVGALPFPRKPASVDAGTGGEDVGVPTE